MKPKTARAKKQKKHRHKYWLRFSGDVDGGLVYKCDCGKRRY